jgi:hypothetical protein
MPSRHHVDAPDRSSIPSIPDDMRDLLALDSEVAELMVAQFLQQFLLGLHGPGPPQCTRNG